MHTETENLLYLKNSSFIFFFINNLIDVPVCFKKSPSLKRKVFELPLLKFTNFLMKKGKREQTLKFFFTSYEKFFRNTLLNKINLNIQVNS
jgi:hypothetical protein